MDPKYCHRELSLEAEHQFLESCTPLYVPLKKNCITMLTYTIIICTLYNNILNYYLERFGFLSRHQPINSMRRILMLRCPLKSDT